ncbi:MAG: hypothetical protein AAFQ94_11415 [Bacteroidota bacterium]
MADSFFKPQYVPFSNQVHNVHELQLEVTDPLLKFPYQNSSGFYSSVEYLMKKKGSGLSLEALANPLEMFRTMLHMHQRNEAYKVHSPFVSEEERIVTNELDFWLGDIFTRSNFFSDRDSVKPPVNKVIEEPVDWLSDLIKGLSGNSTATEPSALADSILEKIYHPSLFLSIEDSDKEIPMIEIPGISSIIGRDSKVADKLQSNLTKFKSNIGSLISYNLAGHSDSVDEFSKKASKLIAVCYNVYNEVYLEYNSLSDGKIVQDLYTDWLNAVNQINDWGRGFMLQLAPVQKELEKIEEAYWKGLESGYDWLFKFFEKKDNDVLERDHFDFDDGRIGYLILSMIFGGSSILVLSAAISFVIDFVLVIIDVIYLLIIGLIAYVKLQISFVYSAVSKGAYVYRQSILMQVKFLHNLQAAFESLSKEKPKYLDALLNNGLHGLLDVIENDFNNIHNSLSRYYPNAITGKISLTDIFGVIQNLINSVSDFRAQLFEGVKLVAQSYAGFVGFIHGIYAGLMRQVLVADYKKMGEDFMDYLWNYFVFDFTYFNSMFLNFLTGWDQVKPLPKLNPEMVRKQRDERDISNYSFWGGMGLAYTFLFNIAWFFGPLVITIILMFTGIGEIELILKGVGWISKGVGFSINVFSKLGAWMKGIFSAGGAVGKSFKFIANILSEVLDWFVKVAGQFFELMAKGLRMIFAGKGDEIIKIVGNAIEAISESLGQIRQGSSSFYSKIDDPFLKSVQKSYDSFMMITMIPVMLSSVFASPSHTDIDKKEADLVKNEKAVANKEYLSVFDFDLEEDSA